MPAAPPPVRTLAATSTDARTPTGGVVGWFGTNAGGCVGGYAYAYGGGVVR